jgi:hypothetical protein
MKTTVLAFLILITAIPMKSQIEHAPTAPQCQADQAVWLEKLESPGVGPGTTDDVTFTTLIEWNKEMGMCGTVDPSRRFQYVSTSKEIFAAVAIRYQDFIDRHDLYPQFIQEDSAGKR